VKHQPRQAIGHECETHSGIRFGEGEANRHMIIDSSCSNQCRRVVLARCQAASNRGEEEMLMLLYRLDDVLGSGFLCENNVVIRLECFRSVTESAVISRRIPGLLLGDRGMAILTLYPDSSVQLSRNSTP